MISNTFFFGSKDGKLSWGYSSFQGRRPSMEDRLSIKSTTVNGETVSLFGVFDGSVFNLFFH